MFFDMLPLTPSSWVCRFALTSAFRAPLRDSTAFSTLREHCSKEQFLAMPAAFESFRIRYL